MGLISPRIRGEISLPRGAVCVCVCGPPAERSSASTSGAFGTLVLRLVGATRVRWPAAKNNGRQLVDGSRAASREALAKQLPHGSPLCHRPRRRRGAWSGWRHGRPPHAAAGPRHARCHLVRPRGLRACPCFSTGLPARTRTRAPGTERCARPAQRGAGGQREEGDRAGQEGGVVRGTWEVEAGAGGRWRVLVRGRSSQGEPGRGGRSSHGAAGQRAKSGLQGEAQQP